MKDGTTAGKNVFTTCLRAVGIGAAVGGAACALLLAAFSLLFVSAASIPQDMLPALVFAAAAAGAFLAGVVAAVVSGQNGLVCGAFSGLLLFLLFLAAGIAFESGNVASEAASRLGAMMIAGGIGGLLAVNRKSRRK
jgi:putative membrane protein (TIGR04086 family)